MEIPAFNLMGMPDQLFELESKTAAIIAKAHTMENDINRTRVGAGRKIDLVQMVVNQLEREAVGVFLGSDVQIEGSFTRTQPVDTDLGVLLQTESEYDIRRGTSVGFFGNIQRTVDGDGIEDETSDTAHIYHLVDIGTLAVRSSLFTVNGRARLQAPIAESQLTLSAVEDFKQFARAEQAVKQSKRDTKWTESLDKIIYGSSDLDMRVLSTKLSRLQSIYGDRKEDYIDYVNAALNVKYGSVNLLCDYLIDYGPEQAAPLLRLPEELIVGLGPEVCLADTYRYDALSQQAYKLAKPAPVLSLRTLIKGEEGEHIFHVPLSAIQCCEFK